MGIERCSASSLASPSGSSVSGPTPPFTTSTAASGADSPSGSRSRRSISTHSMPFASSSSLISRRRSTDTPCSASSPMRCMWTSFIATSPQVIVHASFGYAGGASAGGSGSVSASVSASSARILAWHWPSGSHQQPSVLPRRPRSAARKAGPTTSRRRWATDLPSASRTGPPACRFRASSCAAAGSSAITCSVVAVGDARACTYARNLLMLSSREYLPLPTGNGLANIEPALTVGDVCQPPSFLGRAT
mmetsp:Transcript_53208/g.146978  ORF Transcript_53208/g.146978 Transcript_53208/m.146978 type:complete len:248 (+) Transcript_53208:1906-2649(+)